MLMLLVMMQALNPLDVTGVWAPPNGKAHVEITIDDTGSPRGEIIWYPKLVTEAVDGSDLVAVKDDPDQLLGAVLVDSFEEGGRKWRRGLIYDPRAGKSYKSAIFRSSEDTLAVQGCLSIICRTQQWRRLSDDEIIRIKTGE
ncbi:MAG: DUF2147 domain-containing protein [Pseudomonadota bacterium]